MATKPSSPGPNLATTTLAKQTRSRKAAAPTADAGRAGSAGGIVLEKEKEAKSKSTSTPNTTSAQDGSTDPNPKATRRKPRKLNKDPAPTSASAPAPTTSKTTPSAAKPAEPPTSTEIEALKSRVRGLEAKVEDLYKTGSLDRPSNRSPRRRGKGRKASSQAHVPTLASTKAKIDEDDDDVEEIGRGNADEDGDGNGDGDEEVEELVRLEGELEVARQDLAAFRPRGKRAVSNTTYAGEDGDVEEISREESGTGSGTGNGRHVTLSGSYRIPLPATINPSDVKTIQSGVSAAQNVARSFLEQRRASAVKSSPSASSPNPTSKPASKATRPTPKSVSSSLEIAEVSHDDGKKSWSEWIGGYSVAISRAVKNIEHEAVMESQSQRATTGAKKTAGTGAKKSAGGKGGGGGGGVSGTGKRPGVKTRLSGEQVDGLMR
jgi:hypothetical protein